MPQGKRSDSICCSVRCRQARHRFNSGVGVSPDVAGDVSLRLAYADPPYPGKSRRYYGNHPDYAGEVDHKRLVEQLDGFDGWALSTSAHALQEILALCPPGSRVAVWNRGERPTRSAGPLNGWEPVIYFGGRRDASLSAVGDASRRPGGCVVEYLHDASRDTGATRRVDVLTYRPGARTTDPGRVIGAKPAVFIRWIFDLLGAQPQDEFTDIFPGSGGVMRAWDVFAGSELRRDAG